MVRAMKAPRTLPASLCKNACVNRVPPLNSAWRMVPSRLCTAGVMMDVGSCSSVASSTMDTWP